MAANTEEQNTAYALLRPSVRWLCRVNVHDEPIGAGTQDLVWQRIDEDKLGWETGLVGCFLVVQRG